MLTETSQLVWSKEGLIVPPKSSSAPFHCLIMSLDWMPLCFGLLYPSFDLWEAKRAMIEMVG